MKQITIVAQNRPGLVADISAALGERGINIEELEAETVHAMCVVVLSVDRYDDALAALRDASFDAVTEDALVVRIKDEPGALAKLARRFSDAGIDLRSIRILNRGGGAAMVAISTDRMEEARKLAGEQKPE
jgi:hypothetical protein